MQPGQCLNGKCMHFNKARIKQLKEIVVRIAFTASQLVNPQWQLYFSHKGKSWPSSAEHLQNSNKFSHGIRQHPVWKIIKKKKPWMTFSNCRIICIQSLYSMNICRGKKNTCKQIHTFSHTLKERNFFTQTWHLR